jgi:hypothetical protein
MPAGLKQRLTMELHGYYVVSNVHRANYVLVRLPDPAHYGSMPFLSEAVSLWAVYYDVVIAANRPFIAKPSSPLAPLALKLCREAARACANMLDAHYKLRGSRSLPATYYPAFYSAMTLVVDLIAQGRIDRLEPNGGLSSNASADYTIQQKEEDMRKCMRVLEEGERRFHIAGRLQ